LPRPPSTTIASPRRVRARSDEDRHPEGLTRRLDCARSARRSHGVYARTKHARGRCSRSGKASLIHFTVEPEVGARHIPKGHFSGRGELSHVPSQMWRGRCHSLRTRWARRSDPLPRRPAARALSRPSQYGSYGMVMAIVAFLGVLAQLGLCSGCHVRVVGDYARARRAVVWLTIETGDR
jgi:hypothetical protein